MNSQARDLVSLTTPNSLTRHHLFLSFENMSSIDSIVVHFLLSELYIYEGHVGLISA